MDNLTNEKRKMNEAPNKRKISGIVDASELVSSTANSRRVKTPQLALWRCEYCQADFKHENSFMKHKCTQMERAQEIKTVEGQAAYQYYCEWFQTLKRKAPPIQTFIHSKNYNAFKKLVGFFKRLSLANSSNYIRFMAQNDISPVLWCRDQSFSIYLTYLDSQYDPVSATKDTISFLMSEANSVEITVQEFIAVMTLHDIATLTQRRLITPYFLIFSSGFRQILQNSTNEERNLFVKQVPLQYFATKLNNDEIMTDKIRTLVKSKNL